MSLCWVMGEHHSCWFAVFAVLGTLFASSACQPAPAPASAPAAPAASRQARERERAAPDPSTQAAPALSEESAEAREPANATELLARLPQDELAKRAMLERICAPAIGRYSGEFVPELEEQVVFGCSCCAPFEDCPPTSSSEPVVLDPAAVYPLRHWHAGSFTRPGAQEVAATFMGCEPGAGNRGGTIVLSERGDPHDAKARLEPVVYRSGVNPDTCKVFPKRNQRDRLVCLSSDGQGSTNYTRLLLIDLAREHDSVVEVASFDNDRGCLLTAGPFVSIDVGDFALVDVNGDRQLDVVIPAASQSGVLREADLATCTDESWVPTTAPPPVAERFVYLARGDGFVARSDTARRLIALYRDRDAHRGER